MKKFKNLFYTGLTLTLTPFVVMLIITYFSYGEDKNEQVRKEKNIIHYDTVKVKVKVYDTVVVEKIKYIKKIQTESDSLGN